MNASIGVIVINWNYEHFLRDCLDSIFNQSYDKSKVSVYFFDNGSKDNSVEVVKNEYPQIDGIYSYLNIPLPSLCNKALDIIGPHDFVVLISADDAMATDRFNEQVRCFKESPEIGLVHSEIEYIDSHGKSLGLRGANYEAGRIYRNYLNGYCSINTPSVMYKYEALTKMLPFDENLDVEDFDMLAKFTKNYDVGLINKPLTKYRRHGDSFSSTRLGVLNHNRRQVYMKHKADIDEVKWIELQLDDLIFEASQERIQSIGKILKHIKYWRTQKWQLALAKSVGLR